jgi:hypothetical protein
MSAKRRLRSCRVELKYPGRERDLVEAVSLALWRRPSGKTNRWFLRSGLFTDWWLTDASVRSAVVSPKRLLVSPPRYCGPYCISPFPSDLASQPRTHPSEPAQVERNSRADAPTDKPC